MTKKDFELIAAVLRENVPEPGRPDARILHRKIAEAFAEKLLATNPRFQEGRFLTAAGV